jgi:hypothetical protein
VTDATKQVAADAFFDMLKQSGFLAAPQPPAPRTVPYPTPGVLSGAPAAPRRAGIVGTGAIGTWYRDLGAKRCVIAVEHDHMTITVSESREIDEKTVTAHITFTADYHLARDGSTAVGLITGVDMSFDGDVPEQETDAMMESIAELRKAMEDRPFAMNCRLYGQTLVIGNVRMPEWKDQREQPSSYIAGRYASAATKPMPKQKVMKAPDAKAVPVYAPPAYNPLAGAAIGAVTGAGVGAPVGLPTVPGACPTVPAGSLLPPPSTPAPVPVVRPYGEWVAPTPAVVPSMPEPTPPAPTMSEPVPPNLSATPALGPIGTALDFAVPLNKGPYDHKQLFNFSLGLFGSDADSASPLTPTLEAVGPLPPPLGPDTAPPVADGSFLQGLTSAKPIRQLFSFTTGLFGSQ